MVILTRLLNTMAIWILTNRGVVEWDFVAFRNANQQSWYGWRLILPNKSKNNKKNTQPTQAWNKYVIIELKLHVIHWD